MDQKTKKSLTGHLHLSPCCLKKYYHDSYEQTLKTYTLRYDNFYLKRHAQMKSVTAPQQQQQSTQKMPKMDYSFTYFFYFANFALFPKVGGMYIHCGEAELYFKVLNRHLHVF